MVSSCGFACWLIFTQANPRFSWEFFTTLDYEFDIIRGRRPYAWTIWVSNSGRIFFAPVSQPVPLD